MLSSKKEAEKTEAEAKTDAPEENENSNSDSSTESDKVGYYEFFGVKTSYPEFTTVHKPAKPQQVIELLPEKKPEPVTEKQPPKKERFFRKPDVTAVILLVLLVIFAVYYIIQVYMFDANTIKVLDRNSITSNATSVQSETAEMININTADLKQLMQLNGIGEVKAQAIIDYRNENGSFSAIEDVLNVSGIGEATFEKIKDYICV